MAYSVTTNDGVTINIADESKDSSTLSLTLIGRNATNYGQSVATNTVRLIENFASSTAPNAAQTPTGQLWYNKTDNTMRVFDGSNWKRMTNVPVATADITGDLVAGTSYFNSEDDQLKIYDGATFRNAVVPGGNVTAAYAGLPASGNASNYGAKVEALFLEEQSGDIIPVLAFKYVSDATSGYEGVTADSEHDGANATIMAVFSERAFTVANTDPYYTELSSNTSIGVSIVKGLNQRADYTESTISQADTSEWANTANAVYTGAVTIDAVDLIHTSRQYWTASGLASGTAQLGNATYRFGLTASEQIIIGAPGESHELQVEGTVTLGNASNIISHVYTNDLTVEGNVSFASGIQNIGTSGSPVENLYATNIEITSGTVSSTPTSNTDIANKLYVDNAASSAIATTVTLVPTNITNATHYPLFADAASGNEQARTDTGFTYNPSSGTLTSTIFSGTATQAQYADLAELYLSDQDYMPGTVVKLSGTAEITQTTSACDINVFGVISTDPALLMNSNLEDGLPVALQGRVPVRVIGIVDKGARLVSAGAPGCAMQLNGAYDPRQVIGRALESKVTEEESIIEAVIGIK